MERSTKTRPASRPRLETLEGRLAPNNMLGLAEDLIAPFWQSGGPGWAAAAFWESRSDPAFRGAVPDVPAARGPAMSSAAPDFASVAARWGARDQAVAAHPSTPPLTAENPLDLLAALDNDPGQQSGSEGRSNPGVLPPNSHPFGRSYNQWSAAWWQFVFAIPAAQNPLLDQTGAQIGTGQSGHVFFLTGVVNETGTVTRTGTIPSGTALFFPVLNIEVDNLICGGPDGNRPVSELRALARAAMDGAADLAADIDGVAVQDLARYRVESPVFSYNLPADNLPQAVGCDVPGPRAVAPAVADGFYLMLAPLPVGQHTVHFHGSVPAFGFTLDVTYHLTVAPRGG